MILKENIRRVLKEEIKKILSEKIYNIDDDVDAIYNKFFKTDIDELNRTGMLTTRMFKPAESHTKSFWSETCRKANQINPCQIIINIKNINFYQPSTSIISLTVHKGAFDLVLDYYDGDLAMAAKEDELKGIVYEFTEDKLKGVIQHELTHWLDETFNNTSVTSMLTKRKQDFNNNKPLKNVNAHYIELNAQINSIYQTKRKYIDTWDNLTFEELKNLNPVLKTVYNQLDGADRNDWIKNLKKRMYREGLLGKNMYN